MARRHPDPQELRPAADRRLARPTRRHPDQAIAQRPHRGACPVTQGGQETPRPTSGSAGGMVRGARARRSTSPGSRSATTVGAPPASVGAQPGWPPPGSTRPAGPTSRAPRPRRAAGAGRSTGPGPASRASAPRPGAGAPSRAGRHSDDPRTSPGRAGPARQRRASTPSVRASQGPVASGASRWAPASQVSAQVRGTTR